MSRALSTTRTTNLTKACYSMKVNLLSQSRSQFPHPTDLRNIHALTQHVHCRTFQRSNACSLMASDHNRSTLFTTTQQQGLARHKHQAHLTISTEHAMHGRHEAEPLKVNFGREAPPKRKPPRIAPIGSQPVLYRLGFMGGVVFKAPGKIWP